jgi:hypothetical protein
LDVRPDDKSSEKVHTRHDVPSVRQPAKKAERRNSLDVKKKNPPPFNLGL